jgi:hypothetical protein
LIPPQIKHPRCRTLGITFLVLALMTPGAAFAEDPKLDTIKFMPEVYCWKGGRLVSAFYSPSSFSLASASAASSSGAG